MYSGKLEEWRLTCYKHKFSPKLMVINIRPIARLLMKFKPEI